MRSRAERAALAAAVALLLAGCGEHAPTGQIQAVGHQEPPRAVRTPPPDYPEALACEGVGGEVDLRVTIQPDGSVGEARVQRSSGRAELDEAALRGVRDWTFRPATRDGKPFPITIAVPMTFKPPAEKPQRCFALQGQAG